MVTEHPLQPLTEGTIVLAGIKASNLPEEIKTHPRVIMWDSQHEDWTSKDLPANARAVFVTRWISHNAFDNIVRQTRARRITLFNSVGTGILTRQVKELLSLNSVIDNSVRPTEKEETTMPKTTEAATNTNRKLHLFMPHVDWSKSNLENARNIIGLVPGVETTINSLSVHIGKERSKRGEKPSPGAPRGRQKNRVPNVAMTAADDVAVQMIDKLVNDLHDLRTYFITMTRENMKLRTRLDGVKDKFKKIFED